LSAQILRSRNDPFYVGKQTEGRLREFLRRRCHLNVKPLANVALLGRTSWNLLRSGSEAGGGCVLAIRFSFDADQSVPPSLDASLLDSSGSVLPVGCVFRGGRNPYWEMCQLDYARTHAGSYRLRLTQGN